MPLKSTIDAITVLHYIVARLIKCGVFLTFIDFSTAFDTIDRERLVDKLKLRQIPHSFTQLITSMYSNTKAVIRDSGGGISDEFPIKTGVRQGDPLSPILFIIYIDDLIENLKSDNTGKASSGYSLANLLRKSGTPEILIKNLERIGLLYADDLVLFTKTEEKMQQLLTKLENYADDNGLTVNVGKTKCMYACSGRNEFKIHLTYKGSKIEQVTEFKYLGVLIDCKLSYAPAIKRAKLNAKRVIGILPQIFPQLKYFPAHRLRDVFLAYVIPNFTYGAEIWGMLALENFPDIHAQFLKSTLHLPHSTSHDLLTRELRLPHSKTTLFLCAAKYFIRINSSKQKSPLLKHIIEEANEDKTRKDKHITYNFLAEIENKFFQLNIPGLYNIIKSELNNKMKAEFLTVNLYNLSRTELDERLKQHYQSDDFPKFIVQQDVENALEVYLHHVPLQLRRYIIQVRTNSLLKPLDFNKTFNFHSQNVTLRVVQTPRNYFYILFVNALDTTIPSSRNKT